MALERGRGFNNGGLWLISKLELVSLKNDNADVNRLYKIFELTTFNKKDTIVVKHVKKRWTSSERIKH